MIDQASGLRERLSQLNAISPPKTTSRVITVTSGKGGVGKTNLAVNLAIYFSKNNKRVVIIDADFGLANIEVLMGIVPKSNLSDVLSGASPIQDALTDGLLGIKFLSGGSGFRALANVTERQMAYLIKSFTYLDAVADIIIVDTGAGISSSVINFVKASTEAVIITTPEPTSITDAYALIKSVKEESGEVPFFKIVINRADNAKEGMEIFQKLDMVTNKFLSIPLVYLGSINHDPYLVRAVKKQQPAMLLYPNCQFSKSVEEIGGKLLNSAQKVEATGVMSFMKKLINIFGK